MKAGAAAKPVHLQIFSGCFAVSPALKRKIQTLAKKIDRNERKSLKATLIFIGDARMRQLNRCFRRKDKTTDVLSFPLAADNKSIEGEVYISFPRAKRQAPLFSNKLEGELLRLAAHGFLHLLGYDHQTARQRKEMFAREEKYLTGLGASSSRGGKC